MVMTLNTAGKKKITEDIVERLRNEPEVSRIVIFGSFLQSSSPADIDVAVFQTSDLSYWTLASKYRRLLAPLASQIPMDIIPVRPDPADSTFLAEILAGEVVYEK